MRRDRSSEAWLISLEPERMAATLSTTTATACSSWAMAVLKSVFSCSERCATWAVIRWVRSPLAMACRPCPRAVTATRSSSAIRAFSASTRARSSSASCLATAASTSRRSLAMAASRNTSRAPAMRPISSWRARPGMGAVLSPSARRFMRSARAATGPATERPSFQPATPMARATSSAMPPRVRAARATAATI
ncbi:hypothetical protein D3C80_1580100 [compost metagenome]